MADVLSLKHLRQVKAKFQASLQGPFFDGVQSLFIQGFRVILVAATHAQVPQQTVTYAINPAM
jgi:hypothetical protein